MRVIGLCNTGKIGYLDEIDALLTLQDLSVRRDTAHKVERNYYQCDECQLFHLTSGPICETTNP